MVGGGWGWRTSKEVFLNYLVFRFYVYGIDSKVVSRSG